MPTSNSTSQKKKQKKKNVTSDLLEGVTAKRSIGNAARKSAKGAAKQASKGAEKASKTEKKTNATISNTREGGPKTAKSQSVSKSESKSVPVNASQKAKSASSASSSVKSSIRAVAKQPAASAAGKTNKVGGPKRAAATPSISTGQAKAGSKVAAGKATAAGKQVGADIKALVKKSQPAGTTNVPEASSMSNVKAAKKNNAPVAAKASASAPKAKKAEPVKIEPVIPASAEPKPNTSKKAVAAKATAKKPELKTAKKADAKAPVAADVKAVKVDASKVKTGATKAKPAVAKPVKSKKPVEAKGPAPKKASGRKTAASTEQPKPVRTGPLPRLASGSSGPILSPVPAAPVIRPKVSTPNPAYAAMKAPMKPDAPQNGFKPGDYIVYPAHGVGQILAIEKQDVAGFTLELFVINFLQDKMTLKVPLPKVLEGAIRKLSEPARVKKALDTLTGRARIKRTMWSRRAQEYEAKINSGDLVTIAEVVRDLYRSDTQPEQSYSERQLYEAALDRMAREVAVVRDLAAHESLKQIDEHLQRGPRRGVKPESAESDAGGTDAAGGAAEDKTSVTNIGEAA